MRRDLFGTAVDFVGRVKGRALSGEDVAGSEDDPARFDPALLLELQALWKDVTEGTLDEQFIAAVSVVAEHGTAIRGSLFAWIDLAESVVQTVENRYSQSGRGSLKRVEVRTVLLHIIRSQRLDLPNIPSYLEPAVFAVVADYTTEAIVDVVAQHDMWIDLPTKDRPVRAAVRWATHRVGSVVQTVVVAPIVQVATGFWIRTRFRARVPGAVQDALTRLEAEGRITDHVDPFVGAGRLLVTLTENAGSIRALVRLVFIVVEESHRVMGLDEEARKRWATGLVLALLRDSGLHPPSGPFGVLFESAVSVTVDVAIHLFAKWLTPERKELRRSTAPIRAEIMIAPVPPAVMHETEAGLLETVPALEAIELPRPLPPSQRHDWG